MKRITDIVLALGGLIVLSPLLLVFYLLVRITMGKPAFFLQRRPGLGGKPFRIIKFRTLSNAKDPNGCLLSESDRKTRLGSFMRKSSVDEIPELINVLVGDMSLVGPRPLTMYYLPLYNEHQTKRHDVRPGITGWAQVNGRSKVSWEDKFDMDVWYVDSCNSWLDLKILVKTISQVFRQADTTAIDGDFTKPFRGTGEKEISEEELQRLKNEENTKWL